MHTEPAADPEAVALLRDAARDALALGDAAGAAALLSRALDEPPADGDRAAVLLELGQAHARAGAPEAIAPLSEIVERGEDAAAIAAAAIELSGMLFFAGRAAEGAAILRRAQERLPAGEPAREQLEVALLGVSYTSASARREADATIAALRDPGGPARGVLQATTLATLAMDEVMYLRSASTAIDLAERALAAGLPLEPHRGENWAILALAALAVADGLEAALRRRGRDPRAGARAGRGADGRDRLGAASAHRGAPRRPDRRPGGRAGGDRARPRPAGRRVPRPGGGGGGARGPRARRDARLPAPAHRPHRRSVRHRVHCRAPSCATPPACSAPRPATTKPRSRSCAAARSTIRRSAARTRPCSPWRSAAALSLAELGRHDEARSLAADEVRRARSFGAPRAIGIALRAHALVGPAAERPKRLAEALAVLEPSPARLEHARVLVDLGATFRAAGQRTAAREPLLEGLALAARCGARALERRARAELAAIGVRPRTTDRTGADSLTPSERRVVELAATGGTNREIAQTLFVTEKTVETHLGRSFRKLDISSRRQLPDVLARAAG